MRKIVAFDNVSADGYFASPDGRIDWAVPDEEIFKTAVGSMPEIDTMLFGRRTYEMFEKTWRHALDDPKTAADPHQPGRRSPAMRDQAVFINEATKVVFSRTLSEVTWHKARLVRELDPREIEAMKKGPGKDIIVFGSGTVVSKLTEHGLVDEYHLIVTPVMLGNGRPLIQGLSKSARVRLLGAKEYKSGNVVLRYARAS
jgi:dihydrofolate reductase